MLDPTFECGLRVGYGQSLNNNSRIMLALFALCRSQLMWFLADVIGLFSINLGPFSLKLVPDAPIFSANLGPKNGCNQFLGVM